MKLIVVLLILAICIAAIYLAVLLAREGTAGLARLNQRRAKWRVVPRSTAEGRDLAEDGPRLYLCKPGEEDFLFWPTRENKDWSFDRAQMEAEIQANEFNRMTRELTR